MLAFLWKLLHNLSFLHYTCSVLLTICFFHIMFLKYLQKLKSWGNVKKKVRHSSSYINYLCIKLSGFETFLKEYILMSFIVTHLSRLFKSTLFNFNIWGLTLIWIPVLGNFLSWLHIVSLCFHRLAVYFMVMELVTIMNGSYLFIFIVDDTPSVDIRWGHIICFNQ